MSRATAHFPDSLRPMRQAAQARATVGLNSLSREARLCAIQRNAQGVRQERRRDGVGAGSMEIRPVRTKADYRAALKEVERLWDAEPGTPAGDRVDVLVTLIEAYEAKRFPIPAPDPIAASVFMMEQKGVAPRALEPAIGSHRRVSQGLDRK